MVTQKHRKANLFMMMGQAAIHGVQSCVLADTLQ
jgi:hypothetical protein